MNEKVLISIQGLSKKFSKDIKYNMYYGIKDLLYDGLMLQNTQKEVLRKREFWALKDINFDLREGEILGVVGTNGSGKTTLMRLIAGIYPLEIGSIKGVANLKVTAIFALRSGMQFLFTGRENIYIKGSMYGMSKEALDAKMDFIESFSELGDKLDRPYGNYSSGMRARLAYSIAVATEPDVFIIDEALAVGDSLFKAKCLEHLKQYVQQKGKAVIFISNNIRKVMKVASRVAVLDKGQLIHQSEDVPAALDYYIRNCLKHLGEEQLKDQLQKIKEYDM
ncbi:MAG: ABC transporter ATP-binding protein [Bacteroidota bacterium]